MEHACWWSSTSPDDASSKGGLGEGIDRKVLFEYPVFERIHTLRLKDARRYLNSGTRDLM